jgi:hypothetical protein
MNPSIAARLTIDLTMTVLMLFALAYRITGDVAHEWIGITVGVLFILHNIINRRWYTTLFKGKYHFRRILNTVCNLLLLVTMTVLCVCGILHSRTVFAFMNFPGGMLLRQAHTMAAYWGLIIVAVHIGLHAEMIINAMRKMLKITVANRIRTIVLRILALLIFIYGVWASFDRDMFAKLFLGFSFDFWPLERPAILFFIMNFSIMSIYIFGIYYILKLLTYKNTVYKPDSKSNIP